MKKKNGFTLIELLAVIVILAVIALIAVPQILNILNKARLNAAKDSTYGIIKAAETYATNFMLENNGSLPSEDIEFTCDGTNCNLKTKLTGYNLTNLDKLDFKGTKPKSGTIRIINNGKNIVAENLQINGFNCNYANDTATCTSGSSETPEPTTPVVTGPTSENPTGEGYTNVLKIVYLDPTDLNKTCTASDVNSDTGTKIGCMKWYAYNDDGTNYTMILDHNTTATVAWVSKEDYIEVGGTEGDYGTKGNNNKGPITVTKQLGSDTTGWNGTPRLITADEIAHITGADIALSWSSATAQFSDYFFFETLKNSAPDPYPTIAKYGWLFDNTGVNCTSYGCLNNSIEDNSGVHGYWTSIPYNDSTRAWYVSHMGYLTHTYVFDTTLGVRPVITVEKSLIS